MEARIYKPAKTAMQSGKKNTKNWLLTFIHDGSRDIEPIMGWSRSTDTLGTEVKLWFDSKEEAVNFANKNEIEYSVFEPNAPKITPKSYADNFK